MKRGAILFMMIIATVAPAYSADDVVSRAMKLYEKRHYEEAAAAIRAEYASLDSAKRGAAQLTLGMIYLKNAELHRELYRVSSVVSQDYLKKLSAAPGRDRSSFADLYEGEALLETGKAAMAVIYLEKFAAKEGVEPRYRDLAKVSQGLCFYLNNDKQKAESLWAGIALSDPEVKCELAAAYSKAGLREMDPVSLCNECLAELKRTGKAPSMRLLKNALGVYARSGLSDKGFDLLRQADLKSFSYREVLGKSKVISFYDLSLCGDLATLYLQASISALEKAAADARVRDAAEFYLGQAYALAGNIEQSVKVTASFTSTSQMPQPYKDRIRVWQAANLYQRGRQTDAVGEWDQLSRKQPEAPDLIAEILLVCGRLRIDCPRVAQKAVAAVEAGEGRRFSTLNAAIGRYYLGKQDYAKAMTYLEAGRDKGNKNKIESNDPAMLVGLSEAYYHTKKFSEALEIYFEMSKQYPVVRQLQEALQGVYAMEHKSAGDVKIF